MYTCVTTGCKDVALDVRKGSNSDHSEWRVIHNQHLLKSSNMPETLTSFMYILFSYSSMKWIIYSSPHWVDEHAASWGGGRKAQGLVSQNQSPWAPNPSMQDLHFREEAVEMGGVPDTSYPGSGRCKQRLALGFTFILWVLESSGRSLRKWVKYNPKVWKIIWQNEHARDKGRN